MRQSTCPASCRTTQGNFVGSNDFDAQIKQTFANLDKVLDHFGVTRNQIVQDTVFVVNLHKYSNAVAAAHLKYFGDHRPTSATVGVERSSSPDSSLRLTSLFAPISRRSLTS